MDNDQRTSVEQPPTQERQRVSILLLCSFGVQNVQLSKGRIRRWPWGGQGEELHEFQRILNEAESRRGIKPSCETRLKVIKTYVDTNSCLHEGKNCPLNAHDLNTTERLIANIGCLKV